jgi:hypothetical protein
MNAMSQASEKLTMTAFTLTFRFVPDVMEGCDSDTMPTPSRREPEPASYFVQCCPMITGRQRPGGRVEGRNHTPP